MDLEFLLKRYDQQLDRRDKLTTAVNFPTTIAVLLGSVVATMAKSLSHQLPPFTIGFFVFAVGSTVTLAASLFFLSRVYHGQKYTFLPRLRELEEVRDVDLEFQLAFREAIIAATDENTESNDTRQAYLDRANIMLLVSVVLAGSCGVFHVLDQIFKK